MSAGSPRRAVLLDRDGCLIEDRIYLADPAGVTLLPGVSDGLDALQRAGYLLIVITNQSGIGRGYFSEQAMHAVNRRMTDLLARAGVTLNAIYFCPHAPDAGCQCRKPGTDLVVRAAADFGFDPKAAFMVGDGAADMDLARTCEMVGVQVRATGSAYHPGSIRVPDFASAVAAIFRLDVREERSRSCT